MPPKQAARKNPPLDVRRLRAETLGGFLRLAKTTLTEKSGEQAIQLACSQFFADEAGDAVHETVTTSKSVMMTAPERAGYIDEWDENHTSVYAFGPMCNEEGWNEATGSLGLDDFEGYEEGGTLSPLAIVHRLADGSLRPTWLGALHRPWLDFPAAMRSRDGGYEIDVEFTADPPAPGLVGKEKELYDQLIADPADPGIRGVLGDAWLLRGDPRGELTAISTTAKLTDKLRARAAELVLEHGRAWLGKLQSVVPLSGALFGPGPFARKVVVYAKDAKAFGKVAEAREWATVEEITFANQSHRAITSAMKHLRIVGPVNAKQVAALKSGTWRIGELDYEVSTAADLAVLEKLKLPLTRLRLRAKDAVELAKLARATWWPALQRIELWLPGSTAEPAGAIDRVFGEMAKSLPKTCELAVGLLANGQRSGWMLAGTAKQRRLEWVRPDEEHDLGHQLARTTGLKPPKTWEPDGDDWFHFGLGASIATARAK